MALAAPLGPGEWGSGSSGRRTAPSEKSAPGAGKTRLAKTLISSRFFHYGGKPWATAKYNSTAELAKGNWQVLVAAVDTDNPAEDAPT